MRQLTEVCFQGYFSRTGRWRVPRGSQLAGGVGRALDSGSRKISRFRKGAVRDYRKSAIRLGRPNVLPQYVQRLPQPVNPRRLVHHAFFQDQMHDRR